MKMILLGAGASVPADVPHATKMTQELLSRFEKKSRFGGVHLEILKFAVGGLMFKKGIEGVNPYSGVNVEDLFNAIDTFDKRNSLEVSPFIGSWHSRIDSLGSDLPSVEELNKLNDIIYNITVNQIKEKISRAGPAGMAYSSNENEVARKIRLLPSQIADSLKTETMHSSNNFGIELRHLLKKSLGNSNSGSFAKTLQLMVAELKNLVWIKDAEKVSYFNKLILSANGSSGNFIATLNYDNSIELCCERLGIKCTDGLESINETGSFFPIQDGINLIKLHGSINWVFEKNETGFSRKVIPNRDDKFSIVDYKPAVIFGQKNKLTAGGPFLDLLRFFRDKLFSCNSLVICGYSMRDDHLNEIIGKWLDVSEVNSLIIVDPGVKNLAKYSDFYRKLQSLKPKGRLMEIESGVEQYIANVA